MLRNVLLATLGLTAMLVLSSCGLGYKTHDLRYRLTVEVGTPAGVRQGSSVIQVTITETPFWDLGRPVLFDIRGEAVAVDLPNGQVLFALPSQPGLPDSAVHLLFDTFQDEIDRGDPRKLGDPPNWSKRVAHLSRVLPSKQLKGEARPFLVRFADIKDPASVEEVDPDNLAAAFGPGYALRKTTISITRDAVTHGIRSRIQWLRGYPERRLRQPASPQDTSSLTLLDHGYFAREQ